MPPLGGKSKNKGREGRQSRSRNTTPSSVVSAPISTVASSNTAYLDIPLGKLMIPTNINYDDILERHGGGGGIPDPKHLETMANDLKTLSQLAETRGQACDGGMRELSNRRKDKEAEDREKEKAAREKVDRDEEEKEKSKRAAVEEAAKGRKGLKMKKRKEHITAKEERPLTHGAHGLARQDGLELPTKGVTQPRKASREASDSPHKRKLEAISGSSSPLSLPSRHPTPTIALPAQDDKPSSPSPSSSSLDSHQPVPAASLTQYQTFGPDPSKFDDPTVYHIREVTDDMTEEEKKEIYCVSQYPHDDLSNLIAGTPPDKDFSNAKPSNQVNANTFAAHVEPFLRPLTEEDMAFLKERGDRVTPFIMPRRGKRHYTEVWAEEDGSISLDNQQNGDRLPPNQARGSLEQMDDDLAETDQISSGPMLSRLLSTMRFEHRPTVEDKDKTPALSNGTDSPSTNGGLDPQPATTETSASDSQQPVSLPPATFMPDSQQQTWKTPTPKLTHEAIDERLKAELRHIGFLGSEAEPDYDAHYDDEVAERLRIMQDELRRVSIQNGARKARVLELANERMAHQEYSTILEDLDEQVQQAYSKRTRTLGKGKKNAKRPGGAGGGSHHIPPGTSSTGASGAGAGAGGGRDALGAGVAKPGIGDPASKLMARREKWEGKIGPVFGGDVRVVRGKEEGIFGDEVMEGLLKAEAERWDEEVE